MTDNAIPPATFAPTTTRADSQHADGTLIDRWGRHISYIRLSVTDRCDFRCQYCMPMKMKFLPKREILSLEECLRVARVFAELGVTKVRITGGEPLVRTNVEWLCAQIAKLQGVREVAITTNGSQLPRLACKLRSAGIRRINISLDTLDANNFRRLTRTGSLSVVLEGIEAARAAGFVGGVKINVVMMRGVNHLELPQLATFAIERGMDISFIEEMPLGDIGHSRGDTYYSADEALTDLRRIFTLSASDFDSGGPARYWKVDGTEQKIGFITPHSHNFCASCNRVRVTATGGLYPCLGQNDMVDLRPALRGESSDDVLRHKILQTMAIKPKGHEFDVYADGAKVVRFMSATGG
ncbi:GTP 3',8-cyclase MoaA [Candidatus Persebacteraceae bacterium Df01]|uniref:GTP 3',8-cyclase n=1 Tax=Candidatus Doriopsillibacter californiensis TaxID=2970740 RepID=A0ABT7QMG8_9GAMM|nr:GTP 3',8-cyclase MoaA [Candidatus Persebacteraceae bacterium Df01]